MEHNYKIAFYVGHSHFELESTDQEWLNKKEAEYLKKIDSLSVNLKADEESTIRDKNSKSTQPTLPSENINTNEFYNLYLKKNDIKSRPQIGLFFVYYLEKIQKKTDIKTADILNCFKEIGYPNYSRLNITDILNQNRRKGYLNYVNNYWSLTITGVDYIINKTTSIGNE